MPNYEKRIKIYEKNGFPNDWKGVLLATENKIIKKIKTHF